MGGNHEIGQIPERALFWEGLGLKYIACRHGNGLVYQRLVERRFIYHRAPGHVHQTGGGLHQPKRPFIDQMVRFILGVCRALPFSM